MRAQIKRAFRAGDVKLRVWLDEAGDVRRLQILSSTGDARLNGIIRDEVMASIVRPTVDLDSAKCITRENLGG